LQAHLRLVRRHDKSIFASFSIYSSCFHNKNWSMPKWLIKSALQRAISFLPQSHRWNDWLQTHVTKSLALTPERFELRLDYCRRHLENFFEFQPERRSDFSVFDVGTGWYPIGPVGFYLCGAGEIHTFDIAPLLRSSRLQRMAQLFCEYDERGDLRKWLPWVKPERVASLRDFLKSVETQTPEQFLKSMNIHAVVGDARDHKLKHGSIDLFVSTSVLEYIPRSVLAKLFSEFHQLSRGGAVMSHFINLLDEYSHFDRSITPINFLKYSNWQWKFLDSPLTCKNRLRISDYRDLFKEAGFQIDRETNVSGSAADLERIALAPEFRNYSRADLLVLSSWLVARPAAKTSDSSTH
jgi:hypothetical protein